MVVAHVEQSTSASKNRRSIKKKKARTACTTQPQVDGDEEMASVEATPPSKSNHTAENDALLIEVDPASTIETSVAPIFPALPASAARTVLKSETRRIPIPPHRMTPIKKDWINIFSPLTEILGLQVRMNVQRRCVEIRVRIYLLAWNWHSSYLPADIKSNQRNRCFAERSRFCEDICPWV